MACVELQQILGTECIGDSLPKITGNFAALSAELCSFEDEVYGMFDPLLSVLDSPTIDLSLQNRVLSADVTSITSFFTGANQNFFVGWGGYQKIPGGLIIQWGSAGGNLAGGHSINITYPIAFPHNVFAVTFGNAYGANISTIGSSIGGNPYATDLTTYFTMFNFGTVTQGSPMWMAVGY